MMKTTRLLVFPILVAVFPLPAAAQQGASSVLPNPPEPFKGTISLRTKDSKPDFLQPIQSWSKGITAKNELRTQWPHIIDITPTLLDVVGLPQPTSVNGVAQKPIEGVSMKDTFMD